MNNRTCVGVFGLLCHAYLSPGYPSTLLQLSLVCVILRTHPSRPVALLYACVGLSVVLPLVLVLSYPRTSLNAIPMSATAGVVLSQMYTRIEQVGRKKNDDSTIDL